MTDLVLLSSDREVWGRSWVVGSLLPSQIESLIQSLILLSFVCLLVENDNIILAIEEPAFAGHCHKTG